jgi:hypothetical protein
MRSPKDIAEAIRRKNAPAEPEPEESFSLEDDFLADLDTEEPVEAPEAPTDYKKRIGDILRSTRGPKGSE